MITEIKYIFCLGGCSNMAPGVDKNVRKRVLLKYQAVRNVGHPAKSFIARSRGTVTAHDPRP